MDLSVDQARHGSTATAQNCSRRAPYQRLVRKARTVTWHSYRLNLYIFSTAWLNDLAYRVADIALKCSSEPLAWASSLFPNDRVASTALSRKAHANFTIEQTKRAPTSYEIARTSARDWPHSCCLYSGKHGIWYRDGKPVIYLLASHPNTKGAVGCSLLQLAEVTRCWPLAGRRVGFICLCVWRSMDAVGAERGAQKSSMRLVCPDLPLRFQNLPRLVTL
jgi:hypothetical protein